MQQPSDDISSGVVKKHFATRCAARVAIVTPLAARVALENVSDFDVASNFGWALAETIPGAKLLFATTFKQQGNELCVASCRR
jgi:hypothetical protein